LDQLHIVIPLLVAAAVAALATPVVSRLAHALDVIDRPSERKVNLRPEVPLMGGLAVALGCVMGMAAGLLLAGEQSVETERLEGFLIGGSLLLALGAWDDRWGLGASPKLVVQIAAAAVAFRFGFQIDFIREPFTGTGFELPGWIAWLATTVWIVAVTNAVNLIDGLDGLAAGLGAIIATTLTLICWQAGNPAGVIIGVALVGALLGFLPFNFSPARIFLGDTGALFIGFSLSLLAIEGYRKAALLTFVVPLLALAVPLLDTGLSILRRIKNRRPIFDADRLHMHHRLLHSEGSQRAAVLSLYFLTACFCIIAVSFTRLQGYAAIAFMAAVVILTVRLVRNLGALAGDELLDTSGKESAAASDSPQPPPGSPAEGGNS
jgi:UDP-GlcNAc:undecaprenyl-phosphate GlcNAc-1-phosphate transferase